jgi:hypothetical protein
MIVLVEDESATNLDIDFVTAQHNWNSLANALKISMPVRNVLVGDARGDIKHDDATLALDVITVSETTEFLLASGIPDVEADGTKVGGEAEWMDLDTEGG